MNLRKQIIQNGCGLLSKMVFCCLLLFLTVSNSNAQTCKAAFSAYDDSSATVYFYDGSTGNPVEWYWDFGDGTSSTLQNPAHTFAGSDTFNVCLSINNIDSCFSTYCDYVVISGGTNSPLDASVTITNESCQGAGDGSIDLTVSGGTIPYSYNWDNGSTTEDLSALSPGTYVVTVTDGNGDMISASATVAASTTACGGAACEASFTTYLDSAGTTVDFLDGSTGDILSWYWDFGDGNTSTQQNPVHTYNTDTFSTYLVCLTISAIDSCFSTSCNYIVVDGGSETNDPLNASATSTNESCNGAGDGSIDLTVSGGTPSYSYVWSNGSTTEDISNLSAGTYSVTVTDANGEVVIASATVSSSNVVCTYSLCGNIYLENSNIADVATVYLIEYDKKKAGILTAIDSAAIDSGNYCFTQVPGGDYLVKAWLNSNSAYYSDYLPTYYGDALMWSDATTITLGANNLTVDINLIKGANTGGPGFVGGRVKKGANKASGIGSLQSNLPVMLLDMDDVPIAIAYTNSDGDYTFDNIALGTYQVYVEVSGIPTFPPVVTIDDNNTSIEVVDIIINSDEVTTDQSSGIESGIGKNLIGLSIYPNPVQSELRMSIKTNSASKINISVANMIGQNVFILRENAILAGTTNIVINSAEFVPGIYHINVHLDTGELQTFKFVKIK